MTLANLRNDHGFTSKRIHFIGMKPFGKVQNKVTLCLNWTISYVES